MRLSCHALQPLTPNPPIVLVDSLHVLSFSLSKGILVILLVRTVICRVYMKPRGALQMPFLSRSYYRLLPPKKAKHLTRIMLMLAQL